MSFTLDERMDELLGPAAPADDDDDCPVFLEMTAATAAVVIEGLRWVLYGGSQPPDGRRSLLIVLDALSMALATDDSRESRASSTSSQQDHQRRMEAG